MDPLPSVPPVPVPPPPLTPPQGNRTLLIAILLLVLLAVVGLIAAWFIWPLPQMRVGTPEQMMSEAFGQNDLATTIKHADEILAKDPRNVSVLVTKAFALAQAGSLGFTEVSYGIEAARVAEYALQIDHTNSEAWRALAYSYEIRQDYVRAHQFYAEALKIDPNNARALFGDAHSYDLQGDNAKAEAGYRAAIAADASLDQAHTGLGRMLAAKGDTAGAKAEFETALSVATAARTKSEAAYSIGLLSLDTDRDAAVEYMRRAVTLDPIYPLAHYGLGRALIQFALFSDKPEAERAKAAFEGIDHLEKAVELNPNQSVAYVELARISAAMLNDPEQALTVLANGERAVPKDITLSAPAKESVLKLIAELRKEFQADVKKP